VRSSWLTVETNSSFKPIKGVALADVAEAEHGAGEPAMIEDRRQGEVHPERAAVDAIERIFAGVGHQLQPSGCAKKGAIFSTAAVGGSEAVEQFVNLSARQTRSRTAKQACRGGVGKAYETRLVEPADAVGDGVQKNLLLAVKLFCPVAFLGTRQNLPERCRDRFHGGHRLAVLAKSEVAIKLENSQHPVPSRTGTAHPETMPRFTAAWECGSEARSETQTGCPSARPGPTCPRRATWSARCCL